MVGPVINVGIRVAQLEEEVRALTAELAAVRAVVAVLTIERDQARLEQRKTFDVAAVLLQTGERAKTEPDAETPYDLHHSQGVDITSILDGSAPGLGKQGS